MTEFVTIMARLGSVWIPGRSADCLDGPLAWAWATRATAQGRQLAALRNDVEPVNFPLPLDTWEQEGTWGWKVSRALPDVLAYTAVQIRRKPATLPMSRYAPDRKHHSGLGPYKARDTTLSGVVASTISWHAATTDRAELEDLLRHITHLGARHHNGLGEVLDWTVTEGPDNGWRDRPMPTRGGPLILRPRAPYWHGLGRVPHAN